MRYLARPFRAAMRALTRDGKLEFVRRVLAPLLAVSYRTWIAKHEPTETQLAQQRADARALPYRPLFTVALPAGDAQPRLLDRSIRSVIAQSYDRWELRLIDGGHNRRDIVTLGQAWAARDARVHAAGADASLLRPGDRGDFAAFLGAGDTLAPQALFEVARTLNAHRDTVIVYFDEDRLSADGRTRVAPFLKPSWSPEMLLSVNYLAHAVVRRTLLDTAGAVGGPESWDFALRCSEQARKIHHISSVLYHGSRQLPPPAPEDLRALEAHCQRLGIAGSHAAIVSPGVVRLTWPTREHTVSIIIPSKDHVPLLRRCLTSLLDRTRYDHVEILIVDTGSTQPGTREYYASLGREPRVRVIEYAGAFNFSAVNNAAVRVARGDLLLFLNNDTEALNEDWLQEMVRWAERRETGAVGAKLLYADRTIQHAGIVLGLRGVAHHIFREAGECHSDLFGSVDWYRDYLAVTGACMMMRRQVFDEVGGFDEHYQVAFSDIELCLRIHRHGYRIVYTPFATLRHDEGGTRGRAYPSSDIRWALEHAGDLIASGDPYFHPSLSHESLVPVFPRRGDRPRETLLRRLARTAAKDASVPRDRDRTG